MFLLRPTKDPEEFLFHAVSLPQQGYSRTTARLVLRSLYFFI
ncbi:hypothetical protein BIFPSEUDO_03231 [Bifidobacterium pseudocatenulatum DSM 20438 = JCM 1200 = LMG 10505]|uniref:Uncharacterized protein n=1 Tax=Bifidobacterium pseudocatenulatum DSM 20438 = JCM 1200 = LMG 10505 TaxID=547043 RepID=C0BRG7_BIFPS|nr:hypothetical protein BIFPSEUDO_03231 [Bifidobacterium pseudocatenulatum DSM 20438 = JCM 1200 = LMG 10505]